MTDHAKLAELCRLVIELPSLVEIRNYVGQTGNFPQAMFRAHELANELMPECEPRPYPGNPRDFRATVEARLARLEDVVQRYIGENVL